VEWEGGKGFQEFLRVLSVLGRFTEGFRVNLSLILLGQPFLGLRPFFETVPFPFIRILLIEGSKKG